MNAVAVGFVVYLLVILVVGVITARRTRTLPDYLLAGRRLGPWVVAFSERASGESGWMLLGLTGLAYATGLGDPSGAKLHPALWTAIGGVLGIAASWFLVAKRLRAETERLGALTLPRFFERTFRGSDPLIRFVSTGIIAFCLAFYVAAQFDAAGKALSETFGWAHWSGVWAGAAIVVFYTAMGGFAAVAWTDFVQGWLMLITLVVLPIVVLVQLGGPVGLAEALESRQVSDMTVVEQGDAGTKAAEEAKAFGQRDASDLLLVTGGRSGWPLIAGILGGLGIGLGYAGQPQLLARYMSIRSTADVKTARRVAIVWAALAYGGAVLMGIVALAWLKPGAVADAEKMMPALAKDVFPGWFAGILICGALAAMMSTADSQLLVTTSSVAEDVYHQSINPRATQSQLVWLSRAVTLVIGLAAVALAGLPRSIFDKVLFAWAGLGAAFGPALVLTLWWGRTTRNGVLAGMIVGFATVILWENWPPMKLYSMVPAALFAALAVVLVSLAAPGPRTDGPAEKPAED